MSRIKRLIVRVINFIFYKSIFKYIFTKRVKIEYEERQFIRMVSALKISSDQKVLDVGCGYGGKLKLLESIGIKALGVDINPNIVKTNLKSGYNCMTVDDFSLTDDLYDVVLMSHVIEHFTPGELLSFMDIYLNRIKPDGYLIIVTPLISSFFYSDFDHIKPYHPVGINMVFGNKDSQVQYYSRHRLELKDICFRRGPLRIVHHRGLYFYKVTSWPIILNNLLAIIYRISFGIIGRADGWIGIYQKSLCS